MKCEELNLLDYIEGAAGPEAAAHIEGCKKCRRDYQSMMKFSIIVSSYSEGKKAEEELEGLLKTIDASKRERLPGRLQKKIAELKEKSLLSKIKKVLAGTGQNEGKLLEKMRSPRLRITMASPKDITKSRKNTKRRKQK
jgi:hypothetical protein